MARCLLIDWFTALSVYNFVKWLIDWFVNFLLVGWLDEVVYSFWCILQINYGIIIVLAVFVFEMKPLLKQFCGNLWLWNRLLGRLIVRLFDRSIDWLKCDFQTFCFIPFCKLFCPFRRPRFPASEKVWQRAKLSSPDSVHHDHRTVEEFLSSKFSCRPVLLLLTPCAEVARLLHSATSWGSLRVHIIPTHQHRRLRPMSDSPLVPRRLQRTITASFSSTPL